MAKPNPRWRLGVVKKVEESRLSFYQSLCLWWAGDISFLLQEGGPLAVPKRVSCLTLGHTCWQSKRLYWERAPARRGGASGSPGELLCLVARSPGFYGEGISFQVVSGQSFWLRVLLDGTRVAQARWMPARRILGGGSQQEGFWEVGGHVESPFDLSQTFLVSSGLLVPCTLPRPLVKSLMPTATMVPGPGGRFQSVFPQLIWRPSDSESELQMPRAGRGPEKCSAQFSSFTDEANPSAEETRKQFRKKARFRTQIICLFSKHTLNVLCSTLF